LEGEAKVGPFERRSPGIPTRNIFGFALVGAIVGEFLGARAGMGLLIATAQGSFDSNAVFAAMIVIAVVADRRMDPDHDREPAVDLAAGDDGQRVMGPATDITIKIPKQIHILNRRLPAAREGGDEKTSLTEL